MKKLHIDIETYSTIPITSGVHKYTTCKDFKIQLFGYAVDDEPAICVDLECGEKIPLEIREAITNPNVLKLAYNANFEIQCLRASGFDIDVTQWQCVNVKALVAGLPGKLAKALEASGSTISKLDDKGVHWFSKPTKNGEIHLPIDYREKWAEYKKYNIVDVEAERWLDDWLEERNISVDWNLWYLDHKINNEGIKIDKSFCEKVVELDQKWTATLHKRAKDITGLENPNSLIQLKKWLLDKGIEVENLNAETVKNLIKNETDPEVLEVLDIRKQTSRTSTSKYSKMLDMEVNGLIRGTMQFMGAHTGRWAARGIQPHNMPRTNLSHQEIATIKKYVAKSIDPRRIYEDDILKQMIRSAIVSKGKSFTVADFSAIEARVLAWLADETWAMDVFASHGKIYEAQASQMYNVSLDDVDKNLRSKGKTATLALGYQGGINALKIMGYDGTDEEAQEIVNKYRKANKKITSLWYKVDKRFKSLIRTGVSSKGDRLHMFRNKEYIVIQLPSGRCLYYFDPYINKTPKGDNIGYRGQNSVTKQWSNISTYGGKLVENIVQAIARDCLAVILKRLRNTTISFHVHDEIIVENIELDRVIRAMEHPIKWAEGLVLKAEGYTSNHFRKD